MYIAEPTIDLILKAVEQQELQANEAVFFLFAEYTEIDYSLLINQLNDLGVSFVGAFFPGIIYAQQNYNAGVIIVKQQLKTPIHIIKELGNLSDNIITPSTQKELEGDEKSTAFIFVDGLSAHIATFLAKVYDELGNTVHYIGGGAGSLSLQQRPCILTSEGLLEDAGVICFVEQNINLSVQHGWEAIEGPIIATKTDKNIIYELNWQNAFEVYKSIVEPDSAQQFNEDNFFDIAKGYPFGITIEGREDIVRDPIMVGEGGELVCVGEVDSQAVLNILKGKPQNLIQSARLAGQQALANLNRVNQIFMVDCISRVLFLEDRFQEELKAVAAALEEQQQTLILTGILSLGEISSDGNGPLHFYNKTMVVGALY